MIAGIAVGSIAATALLLTLLFLFRANLLAFLLSLIRRRKTSHSCPASRSKGVNSADEEPLSSLMSFHNRAAPDSFAWVDNAAFTPPPPPEPPECRPLKPWTTSKRAVTWGGAELR
ncbi:hypothetical protein W97_07723 [Coniosporium apollinis CBS 100218]|uniref:Uncharacterized protein n=1 Tax=Coniosporium apollinis (strain CBS 100218) TaxID=1168221 RepID=R7Z2Z2_CONA1|nr:uncharacterized protein W97_07723 [Coniosporium apollinis CBS 100218]EON68399.1 hypothetical protein W97_07723 [Coniosporium apollinis CBS 100218]